MNDVAAVDRLEEVTDGQLTGIDLWRSRSRLEIAVTSPYGHDHGLAVRNLSGTVTVSFGPSKTANSYLPVTADGLSRSKLAYVYYFTVLAAYIACTAGHRFACVYRCDSLKRIKEVRMEIRAGTEVLIAA